jgi:hypothetical protein
VSVAVPTSSRRGGLGRDADADLVDPPAPYKPPRGRTQLSDTALERLVSSAIGEVEGVEPLRVSLAHAPRATAVSVLAEIAVDRPDRLADALDELHAHLGQRIADLGGLDLSWLEVDVVRLGRVPEPARRVE